MTLQGYGEDRLVAALTRALPQSARTRVGPGDDCAVIGSARAGRWQLLKTEAVIEGVHFLPGDDRRRVGWKAICRALSDIAAMGGVPAEALITVAVAPTEELASLQRLYVGIRQAARRFSVSVVGGETSRSPGPLFINVALTGWVERTRCVLRSGGQTGDLLYVTGRLGGSRSGKHLDFIPRLVEARWLTQHFRPTAMMDLSDGLAADLPRLAQASGCSWECAAAALPCTAGVGSDAAQNDGEDYELLFSISSKKAGHLERAWRAQFTRLPLTCIGALTPLTRKAARPTRRYPAFARSDTAQKTTAHGYDHFS